MGIQPTNAGIDFQQRVAAWFMLGMLFDIKLDTLSNLPINQLIKTINFESSDKIDDLVITSEDNNKLFMQMKRSICLSDSKTSEFYGVIQQFVSQEIQNNYNDIAYLLVTSGHASTPIREIFRRLLDCIRTANSLNIRNELNKQEIEVLDKVIHIINEIYLEKTKTTINDVALLNLLKKIHVEMFDIESGQSFEKTVKMCLYNKVNINVELIWNTTISMALNFGANRQTLDKKFLFEKLKVYIDVNGNTNTDSPADTLLKIINSSNDIEVNRDYVLALSKDLPQNTGENDDKNKLFLIELYRFSKDGKRKIVFKPPNHLILNNGMEFTVIFRSATFKGIERFVHSSDFISTYSNHEIIILPIEDRDTDSKCFEEMHEDYLKQKLKQIKEVKCINCGNAIFQENPYICEIDNTECQNDIGLVHKECVLPVDRVLGIAQIPSKEDYSFLKNFDINLWIKQIKEGQYGINGIKTMRGPIKLLTLESEDNFSTGNYCVRTLLENGLYKYSTKRGTIHKLTYAEAQDFAAQMNTGIEKSQLQHNPICYTDKSFTFGHYNQLIAQLGDQEECLLCKHSEVVKYNECIAKMNNKCTNCYAPLIYLVVDEKPLIIRGIFPLFSDPLQINTYLNNWSKCGINIKNYQVQIIKDDNELCLKIISLIMQGIRPMIDVKFDMNKEPIQAIVIQLMQELELYQTLKEDKEV